ncbi:MAG: hypothetical protein WCE54_02745 [Ignavibacteriaceae bacterium]
MVYAIDYESEKRIIDIKIKGKLNFKLAEKYSIEALKLAHENSCHKFLFNHEETKLDCSGIYKLYTNGEALEKFGFKSFDKIAIVISRIKDDHLFFQKIEHNAKWSNFKYFDNTAEAVNWLGSDN